LIESYWEEKITFDTQMNINAALSFWSARVRICGKNAQLLKQTQKIEGG